MLAALDRLVIAPGIALAVELAEAELIGASS
jgi:hypothetical protein